MHRRFASLLVVVLLAAWPDALRAQVAPNALAAQEAARTEELVGAEVQRVAALVAGDTAVLQRLFADTLTYGHADGRLETKEELLLGIQTGRQRYHAINPGERTVRTLGEDHALIAGTAELLVGPADAPLKLRVRFLAVYARALRGGWQLIAYQSTRLPAAE